MSTEPDFSGTEGEMGYCTGGIARLASGETVDSSSLDWLRECQARHRHVENLMHIAGVTERRGYIAAVASKEGNESARRLSAAFGTAWAKRQEDIRSTKP